MEIDLTPEDFLVPVPRTFWRWTAPAAVVRVALGLWLAGRLDRGPRPEAVLVALERIFSIYGLGAFVLVAFPRTRRLGLLLVMGVFIFFFSFVGGFGIYWLVPGVRAVR